jgi:histidinol-phosphate aminotransferase
MSCDFMTLATDGVRRLTPYQPGKPIEELERELGLSDIVKLASNESPIGPSPRAIEAARVALTDLARYPDGNGFALKSRLAERHAVSSSQLTLGNGSNDVLEFVVRAFAAPGHEVVYSEHAFAVYPLATLAAGATPVSVPAKAYGHDLDAMAAAVTERTRVVFVANPNNPTGTWVSAADLERFVAGLPEDVLVVVDEAYCDYVMRNDYPECVGWIARFPNLIVTRTFSKAYGLAALRVGYAVSHDDVADLLNRVRQPFNTNSVALAAAAAALDDEEHVRRAREVNDEGLVTLGQGFTERGLDYIPSLGNFISFKLPRPAGEVYQGLLENGVIVRPVASYGLPEHLRVSVGTADENRRFLQALDRVLGG